VEDSVPVTHVRNEGDGPGAWDRELLELHKPWLMSYLLAACGDYHRAEDLVEETFMTAYRKRDSFEQGTSFGGWLRGIARRHLLEAARAAKRQPIPFGNEILVKIEDEIDRKQREDTALDFWERQKRALKACLARLSAKVRRVIRMRYLENVSSKDVARTLGASVSAVDVACHRGRAALAECVRTRLAAEE
jgi:RNA polymerase sigma-70 factor (ECF subfamily)